ncbi:MAG: class I SAM-dependent RNA methyltransferase [Nitrospirae bacterium]|nr:class I SAM-dependent RNA methyltransferase [Nitrospirota bacterium]
MKNLVLKIDRPAFGGQFIARHEGKVVMVRGQVLPGETVEVAVEEEKRDYLAASAVKVLEASPLRIAPQCEHFGVCGGCSFQHVPYELQVSLKEEIFRDCLRRIAGIEVELADSIESEDPWNYRQRGQFKISDEGFGLHKKGTNEVVHTAKCLIMDNAINAYVQRANKLVQERRIKEFHITSGDTLTAQIITRRNAMSPPDAEEVASQLIDAGLSGLMMLIGDNPPLSFGKAYITTGLLHYKYTLSPPSFIQANWRLNQSVVKIIRDALQSLKGKKVLDLYAGAGNFSIPLAGEAEVTAVEGNPYAIEDGMRNVEINDIRNCAFIRSTAEKFRPADHFDIVILDPPRPGLSHKVMIKVLEMQPERIVYMSCNPTTFARDLRKLSDRYKIDSVRMIDFFPQTFHIEALAFLSLR